MKINLNYLAIGSLCLTSFVSSTYAQPGYFSSSSSSSSGDNGGYVTSSTSSAPVNTPSYIQEPKPQHKAEHRNEHRIDRKNFAISINVPGLNDAPQPAPYYAPERRHHHRGPQWIELTQYEPLPPDAVNGGYQFDGPLYVCQARFRDGVHPGKVYKGNCNISYGGNEIVMPRYQVLVSRYPLNWISASFGDIPPDAIEGGFARGRTLFICQARYRGGMHPGKVVGQNCNIAWGGKEVSIPYYNVLVR